MFITWLDRILATKSEFKLKTHTTCIKKMFDEKCWEILNC